MGDTPRTDAFYHSQFVMGNVGPKARECKKHAQELERELTAAQERVKVLESAVNAAKEMHRAIQATGLRSNRSLYLRAYKEFEAALSTQENTNG